MKLISTVIPHTSIRIMRTLEKLRDQGVITQELIDEWIPKETYKELMFAIFRVIGFFRQAIVRERAVPFEASAGLA